MLHLTDQTKMGNGSSWELNLSPFSGDNSNHSPADSYPYIKLPWGQAAGWSEFPDLNWLNLLWNGNTKPLRRVNPFSACFSCSDQSPESSSSSIPPLERQEWTSVTCASPKDKHQRCGRKGCSSPQEYLGHLEASPAG